MNKKVRLALSQINAIVGDFDGNSRKVLDYIEKAKACQADIIIFPELTLCGYPPEDLLHKPKFIDDSYHCLDKLISEITGITAIVGVVRKENNAIFNSAVVIADRKIWGFYDKMYLPNYSVFDEKRYFKAGKRNVLFDIFGVKVGITICEDIWRADGPHKEQAENGADIIFNLSASPYYLDKQKERQKLVSDIAYNDKVSFGFVNLVGGQDELVFDGASSIFSPTGELIARAKQFAEDIIISDLDLVTKSEQISPNIEVIKIDGTINDKTTEVSANVEPALQPNAEIYAALTMGLKDYVTKNGFKKVVLGISGGIDSAFTASIAVDALGKENVIGVTMPSRYSSSLTKEAASKLIENLGITSYSLPIEQVFCEYLNSLAPIFKESSTDATEENLQARVRGNFLMALSNKFGWLVLTTGNKSETAVGYSTLYGDMAGGFAVIKDVPKTLVYTLAKYINENNGEEIIPRSIIDRPPSAELRFDQKDQDSLPEYDILDAILKEYVENDRSLEQIVSLGFDNKLVSNIIGMVDFNEYKRRQAPPGIKITAKAFGRDRRMPIVNKYRYK